MEIRYNPNQVPVEGASKKGRMDWFSGRKKARIHLGLPNDNVHSIALVKEQVFSKEDLTKGWGEKARSALGLRNWVALKVKAENSAESDTYVKVNKNSLKKRMDIKNLDSCVVGGILNLESAAIKKVVEMREAFDQVSADGNALKDLPPELKKNDDFIRAAVNKNPEAIQHINPEWWAIPEGWAFEDEKTFQKNNLMKLLVTLFEELPVETQKEICQSPQGVHLFQGASLAKQNDILKDSKVLNDPNYFKAAAPNAQMWAIVRAAHLQDKELLIKLWGQLSPTVQMSTALFSEFKGLQLLPSEAQKALIDRRSDPMTDDEKALFNKASKEVQLELATKKPQRYMTALPEKLQEVVFRQTAYSLKYANESLQRKMMEADPGQHLKSASKEMKIAFGTQSMYNYMQVDEDIQDEIQISARQAARQVGGAQPVFPPETRSLETLIPTLEKAVLDALTPSDWNYLADELKRNPELLRNAGLESKICDPQNKLTAFLFQYLDFDFQRTMIGKHPKLEHPELLKFAAWTIQTTVAFRMLGDLQANDTVANGDPSYLKLLSSEYQNKVLTIKPDLLEHASDEVRHQWGKPMHNI